MEEFKGTKGNWITFCNDETKEYSVGGGNDERYFIVKVVSEKRSIETNNANTNLIASAPDLLKSCKALRERLVQYMESSKNIIKGTTSDILNADKAIKKALKL